MPRQDIYLEFANSLLDLSIDQDKVQLYLDQINYLNTVFLNTDKSIEWFFGSRNISFNEKEIFIDKFIYKQGIEINIINFIKVIIKHNQGSNILRIFRSFIKLANTYLNSLLGQLYSKNKIDEREIKQIEVKLSKELKQKIILENIIDPSIIGGYKLVLNNLSCDLTLNTKLDNLKKHIFSNLLENNSNINK